jgi:hypothetical protein
MKIQLSNVDGYQTYAYLEPITHPAGYCSLKITSQWKTAKDPDAEQVRFSILLSPTALNNLRDLIK